MGIASGLIWIVIGIGYIIYRGLREETATTLTVLTVVVGIIAAGAVFCLTIEGLNTLHPSAGSIFELCVIVGLYIWYLISCRKYKEKQEAERQALDRKLALQREYREKAKAMLTDEEIKEYAIKNAKKLLIHFDEKRPVNYWKSQWNYEKVVNACAFDRGRELMKQELGEE